ncbi:hypothetical protein DLAC_00191 [Tieghemostelium lacteum]|uniref:EGF-like domain-containing protein n=1 Tax=Tieghemostelium lacteum TaxID=361077 RepID=A0A152A9I6_TIELA|nr:hypothetical protein DLAC_00191 [Tieghemostelium lacteum]|eukprot:KYR02727.1 hypothetical protein DLAC_00191 [Tieghemostelium lacteum]
MKIIICNIYLFVILFILPISINSQNTFLIYISEPTISLNTQGKCVATVEYLFNSSFRSITSPASATVVLFGENYYVTQTYTLDNGQYVSFTLKDALSKSYTVNTEIQCIQNPTPLAVESNLYWKFFNRKMFNEYVYTLAIIYNAQNLGFQFQDASGSMVFKIQSTSNRLAPMQLNYLKYNYPYSNYGPTYQVQSVMYTNSVTFTYNLDIPSYSTAPTVGSGSVIYNNGRIFSMVVLGLGPQGRLTANAQQLGNNMQVFPVYGNENSSTWFGHFLGFPSTTNLAQQSVNVYAIGQAASPLLQFKYTTPTITIGTPSTGGYTPIGNQSLHYSHVSATVVNQGLSSITLETATLLKPLKMYPYGFTSGTYAQLDYQITYPLSKYGKDTTATCLIDSTAHPMPFSFIPDNIPPSINNVEFKILENTAEVLIRVSASDNISGVHYITFSFGGMMTFSDLSIGTPLSGTYEKIFNLVSARNTQVFVYDFAGNLATLTSNMLYAFPKASFDIHNIWLWYFEKNDIDVSSSGSKNTLYISADVPTNKLFGFKLISTFEIAAQMSELEISDRPYDMVKWDPISNMFKVDFYIPARMFFGNLDYVFMVDGIEYDTSAISSIIGTNSTLRVKNHNADEMPPIVQSYNIYPSSVINVNGVDVTFGIKFNITDQINGIESVNVTIASNLDPVGKIWSFKLNGELAYTTISELKMKASKCIPQIYYIKDLSTRDTSGHFASTSYFPSTFYKPYIMTPFYLLEPVDLVTITVNCANNANDNTGPVMSNYALSTNTIDVLSINRNLTVYFEVSDPLGISYDHTPVIYLEGVYNKIMFKQLADIVGGSNETHGIYRTIITVPYGFGIPDGFGVSVFGLMDSAMNIRGNPFGSLVESGKNSIVTTTKTNLNPIIERSHKFPTFGGSFAIYGKKFGNNSNSVKVSVNEGTRTINYTASDFGVFSNIYIKISNLAVPIKSQLNIIVYVGNLDSNVYSVSEFTPTATPIKCPGSPKECSGNGQCIIDGDIAGCQCNHPYSGYDCSSEILLVPQPLINPTVPNTTIDFTPSGKDIFYSTIVSIISLREIQLDLSVLHEYTFNNWTYKDITSNLTTSNTKIYQYLSTIKHPIFHNETLVNVTIEWFNDYKNITFANEVIQMTPSSIKYRIELNKYPFDRFTNTMDVQFLISIQSTDSTDSCSRQKQGTIFQNDFVNLQLDNHSFYGRFIKRAIVDGRNTTISNTVTPNQQKNSESSTIVSIHLPNFREMAILDPDFSILVSHNTISSDTKGSICRVSEKKGISKTQLIGIIIGGVAFLAMVAGAIIFVLHKKKKNLSFMKKLNKLQWS